MSILPIVERELRVAARRTGTYWLRCLMAFAFLLIWLSLMISHPRYLPGSQMGSRLFATLSVFGLGFCLLAGFIFTADCVSVEKRNGTLGLLFLTPLRAADIILGKLAATSLPAIFGLLALFPIQALSLLLGGITGGEVVRVVLVLTVTLFFSLAAGILASTLCRDVVGTLIGSFLFLLIPTGFIPMLGWIIASLKTNFSISSIFLVSSPGYTLMMSFDRDYQTVNGAFWFWCSWLFIFFLAIGCLTMACRVLPACRLDRPSHNHRINRHREARFGYPQTRARFRTDLIEFNPFYWLCVRDRLHAQTLLTIIGLLVAIWPWLLITAIYDKQNGAGLFGMCIFYAYGVHFLFKVLVAIEASRQFSAHRHSGFWELLLTTPLKTADIIAGQWLAFRPCFKKPFLIVLALNLGLLWAAVVHRGNIHMSASERNLFCEVFLGGALALVFDFWALKWTGMEAALSAAHHYRAVLLTLVRVMLFPWLAFGVMILIMMGFKGYPGEEAMVLLGFWYGLSYLYSIVVGNFARLKLTRHFRRLAGSG